MKLKTHSKALLLANTEEISLPPIISLLCTYLCCRGTLKCHLGDLTSDPILIKKHWFVTLLGLVYCYCSGMAPKEYFFWANIRLINHCYRGTLQESCNSRVNGRCTCYQCCRVYQFLSYEQNEDHMLALAEVKHSNVAGRSGYMS